MNVWALLVLLVAPVVILATGGTLPAEVGSHFVATGSVDGRMSRGTYLLLMSALTSGTPWLTWWLQWAPKEPASDLDQIAEGEICGSPWLFDWIQFDNLNGLI